MTKQMRLKTWPTVSYESFFVGFFKHNNRIRSLYSYVFESYQPKQWNRTLSKKIRLELQKIFHDQVNR